MRAPTLGRLAAVAARIGSWLVVAAEAREVR